MSHKKRDIFFSYKARKHDKIILKYRKGSGALDMDTIAAISTPPGEGGIGIVRLSGPDSLDIAGKIFNSIDKRSLSDLEERKLNYGHIVNDTTGKTVDEALVVYMKEPKTYTREDLVEIHCHGGVISVKRILELVLSNGCRLAERGEFTKRAFLNGRIDLSQAEAVIDLIKAKTDSNFDMSLNQLGGSMSKEAGIIKELLLEVLAHIQASIDFSEHDVEDVSLNALKDKVIAVRDNIERLLSTADTGRIVKEGIRTVILGKPNVGKSSLMNRLLGENRAIVTEIPGTTRDVIEEFVNVKGVPLKIIDTAGIRETEDLVEKIGISKAKEALGQADLAIAVFDASRNLDKEDLEIIEMIKNKKCIVLMNKMDLDAKIDENSIVDKIGDKKIITTSMLDGYGLDEIHDTLVEMFFSSEIKIEEDTVVTNVRQKNLLLEAKGNIDDAVDALNMGIPIDCIEVDVKNCWENIGAITGEAIGEDIIDKIFSDFCIGK